MLDREAAHSERCADYEKRTEALQERAKRIAQEYQKQAKEVRPTDSKPRTGDAAKDAALLSDIEPSEENLERIHTSGSQPKHSREGRTRTRPSSRLEKEQRSPLRTPVHMLQRKTPPVRYSQFIFWSLAAAQLNKHLHNRSHRQSLYSIARLLECRYVYKKMQVHDYVHNCSRCTAVYGPSTLVYGDEAPKTQQDTGEVPQD